MSKFKLSDRGYKDTILLIPGWATDYRIFASLDIHFNYLLPVDFSPVGFGEDFLGVMKENGIKNISVLGWSMGAFLACDLLKKYGDRINEIILVSARKKYEKASNEKIKTLLMKNRKGFLYKFYRDCFSEGQSPSFEWFKENLLKDYLARMELNYLVEGLDYLSQNYIDASMLKDARITFVHGRQDKIAPVKEVMDLKDEYPTARCVLIERAGHMPFLSGKFKRIFDEDFVL